MSLQLAAFAFGCFLLMITILGGGFEIKEIKVPKVGGASRLAAFLCGFLFIGGGIRPALVTGMLDRGAPVEISPVETRPQASAPPATAAVQAPPQAPRSVDEAVTVSTAKKRVKKPQTASDETRKRVPWKERARGAWKEIKGGR